MLSTEKNPIKVFNYIRINHNIVINFAGTGFKQWSLQDKEFVQIIDNFHLVACWRCTIAAPEMSITGSSWFLLNLVFCPLFWDCASYETHAYRHHVLVSDTKYVNSDTFSSVVHQEFYFLNDILPAFSQSINSWINIRRNVRADWNSCKTQMSGSKVRDILGAAGNPAC